MVTMNDQLKTMHYTVVEDGDNPEPSAGCDICGGTGVIRYAVPFGDPRWGKLHPCPNRYCPGVLENHRRRQELVLKRSHWSVEYEKMTFESWHEFVSQEKAWKGKGGAYCAAFKFADNPSQPFGAATAAWEIMGVKWDVDNSPRSSLVLTGDVGLGKTALALSAANMIRANGGIVIFLRVQQLIEQIRRTFQKDYDGPPADDLLEVYRTVPVLIIDEFGIKNYTDFRLETLEDVMRARDRNGLPFMATTNLTLDQFYESWGKQTADIVAKAHWINMTGQKLRDTVSRAMESF